MGDYCQDVALSQLRLETDVGNTRRSGRALAGGECDQRRFIAQMREHGREVIVVLQIYCSMLTVSATDIDHCGDQSRALRTGLVQRIADEQQAVAAIGMIDQFRWVDEVWHEYLHAEILGITQMPRD
jgi:hypothetical protein